MTPPKDMEKYRIWIERKRQAAKERKHSELTKKKIAFSHLGKKRTLESRLKQSQTRIRRIEEGLIIVYHKNEFKEMLRIRNLNNNPMKNLNTREKLRQNCLNRSDEISQRVKGKRNPMFGRIGFLNPNWRNGTSKKPYPFEFDINLKERIRKRDFYKCQLCEISQSKTKIKLSIHHIDRDKENCDINNLITLCAKCHSRITNKYLKIWPAVLKDILQRKVLTNVPSICS